MSSETQGSSARDGTSAPNDHVGPYAHMFLSIWFPWLVNRDLFPHPYLFLVSWFFTGLVALMGITFFLQNICEYEDHCNVPMSNQRVQHVLNLEGHRGSYSSSELPGFVCLYWVAQLRTARAGTLFTESMKKSVDWDWRGAVNERAGLGHGPAVDKDDTWKNDVKSTGINYLPLNVDRPWVNGLAATVCEPKTNGTLNKMWRNSARRRALGGEEIPWCPEYSPAERRARNMPLPACSAKDERQVDEHGQPIALKVPAENLQR